MSIALAALLVLLPMSNSRSNTPSLRVDKLRCEHLVNPLGIDEIKPRFSWILDSQERGQRQTAYQVIVSSTLEGLLKDQGDLWDSGKVMSDATIGIEYAGRPLASGQDAYWKVKVWDAHGKAAASPGPGRFEIGLLKRSDWKGSWIGMVEPEQDRETLAGAKWIWYPEGEPAKSAPSAKRTFRYRFKMGGELSAKLYLGADNDFDVRLNGRAVSSGSGWANITVATLDRLLVNGENTLEVIVTNRGGPAGFIAKLNVRGHTLAITDKTWESSTNGTDWVPAMELGGVGFGPWGTPKMTVPSGPSPHLWQQFSVDKPVKSAFLRATARGLYIPYLNGKRIGQDVFTPGWTDYRKRIQYQTYDVTEQVEKTNALGFILGDGWYCGHVGWSGRQHYGPKPMVLAQLEITYTDGSRQVIATDRTWQVLPLKPIKSSDMLMGEEYDAREANPGWCTYVGQISGKLGGLPDVQPLDDVPLVAQRSETVQKLDELEPLSVKEVIPGTFIFDLGQNMVGWARLKVKGKAGTQVKMRFAEILNPDGTIYTTNLRSAKQTDLYTLSGKGTEIYEPHFTFHGFRYVEVTGYPGKPSKDAITGIVLGSAMPQSGTFECSNPLVKQLQHNIFWGQRGNYLEVPTDCPQRDERLGWMGDAQVFIRTATYNNDVSAFMTKWIQDVRDAQSKDGGFSDVAPRIVDMADGAPAWGDAGVIVPWTLYLTYADKRLLERHYESAKAWVKYIQDENPDLIWIKRSNNNFGDWLNIEDDTPRPVLATAYFAYSTRIVGKMAAALGKKADAAKYEKLFKDIAAAFVKRFGKPDGKIEGDTQTAYVLALWFDLLPEAGGRRGDSLPLRLDRPTAAHHLIRKIREKNDHLSTGFVGVGYLAPTLTSINQKDLAYKLLLNETFPSWGYSIRQGATTIWERWDGWRADKGFQDPGMNSFNHYSLGSVGEWLYHTVAGIDLDPAEPGFKHIILRPTPGGGLTWAKATYDSVRGRIVSSWKIAGGKFVLDVTIPPSCTADLHMPSWGGFVRESGEPVEGDNGLFHLGSGSFRFETLVAK